MPVAGDETKGKGEGLRKARTAEERDVEKKKRDKCPIEIDIAARLHQSQTRTMIGGRSVGRESAGVIGCWLLDGCGGAARPYEIAGRG